MPADKTYKMCMYVYSNYGMHSSHTRELNVAFRIPYSLSVTNLMNIKTL